MRSAWRARVDLGWRDPRCPSSSMTERAGGTTLMPSMATKKKKEIPEWSRDGQFPLCKKHSSVCLRWGVRDASDPK
jgi:hypothetical protein